MLLCNPIMLLSLYKLSARPASAPFLPSAYSLSLEGALYLVTWRAGLFRPPKGSRGNVGEKSSTGECSLVGLGEGLRGFSCI